MKKVSFLLKLFVLAVSSYAQPNIYTSSNAHSHNDYAQPFPFSDAYQHQFGSIEADIFLIPGSDTLWVGHSLAEVKQKHRSLDVLYLKPLAERVKQNNGAVYREAKPLQILIDIKSDAKPTLDRLVDVLKNYSSLTKLANLKFVISGNRPDILSWNSYPNFIQFDGILGTVYPPDVLNRIEMMSTSFQLLSKWDGKDSLLVTDRKRIMDAIKSGHDAGKTVRLWAAPDTESAWKELKKMGVDFINTDKIDELSRFLSGSK